MAIMRENIVVPVGQPCPPGYDPGGTIVYEDGTANTICWKQPAGLGALADIPTLLLLALIVVGIVTYLSTSGPSSSPERPVAR